MSPHRLAGLFLVACAVAACGSELGSCEAERIDVSLPATLSRGGTPVAVMLAGQVSPPNVGVPAFTTLRSVLTGDVGSETGGVIWTVPAFDPEQGWVVVAIDAPVAAGEVLAVGSTYAGAGWGVFDLPADTRIAAGIRAGDFAAASVTGTVEVLGVAPLRLRLDLTGIEAAEAEVRVRGDATFSYFPGPPSCT